MAGKDGIVKPMTVKKMPILSACLLKRRGGSFVQAEMKKTRFHDGKCISKSL